MKLSGANWLMLITLKVEMLNLNLTFSLLAYSVS